MTRKVGNLIYESSPIRARGGSRYVFVAAFPFGPGGPAEPSGRPRRLGPGGPPRPPGPFNFLLSDSPTALALRVIAVILTAGVLCYLLARYMVSPVVKLRAVTRQAAGGDLSARVGPLLGKRRDELADMGRDFDRMATQVELLMGAQQRLLRDISHELRSPLTRLGVALHQVRKRTGPAAAGHLARIEREAGRLNEMIGQLLTLVRWESGAGGLQREPVDLAHLVHEVAEDANYEARSRNRAVRIVRCDECRIVGTPSLLRSAVENVVRNAVRYTTEETTVEVSLRYSADEASAVISVADKGAGVPKESIADIFRPFYRVEDARDRESGGTGLGLAITARAVSLHGGAVTAFNASDGGFVVELRLPVALDQAGGQTKRSTL